MKKHKVIILVGPGGVGKSTISQYLCYIIQILFKKLFLALQDKYEKVKKMVFTIIF